MGHRVVQWNNGGVDGRVLRALIDHDSLEVIGVGVTAGADVGVDVGLLADCGPVGITTSADLDALLGMIPDCVWYSGAAATDPVDGQSDLVRILRSGANAVAPLASVGGIDEAWLDALRAPADEGAATLLVSSVAGDDPAVDDHAPDVDALVDAIPAVCTARPGVLSWLDISSEATPEDDRTSRE